ncbi:hypothetical protein KEK_00710 [Mycolicibacterium thermoresistibile ATCC 19527]|uniref:Ferredoxin n=2 Tax=Mycolicibacterium thermoresistibile TaxID=1797 RepID=G7CB00_MYCT3|nr:hypothetical protein KEK_00710 [Mycolicibacterium thermoresistibile ATCC 19527]
MCEATAPNLFEVSDDGQAIVLTDEIAGEDRAAAREAVDNCPAGALTITE